MAKESLKKMWYWLARWGCRVFCILFFGFRSYGSENVPEKGAVVLVSNHQSYLDPVLCGVALKRRLFFVARDSLFENRFFSRLIYSLNAIPVKRGKADISSMKKIISELKRGGCVCLYPEATRTKDGRISAFKGGFGLLCKRGGAAVVPVLIDGAYECWPRHKKMFSAGSIVVCYGEVIPAEEVKKISDKKLAKNITETLREMQRKYRIKQGKQPYGY